MKMTSPESLSNTVCGVGGINALLGLWTVVSPFELSFNHLPATVWNNLTTGLLVAGFALIRVSKGHNYSTWSSCNFVIGLWLIVSPFVLGFSNASTALWNNLIVGALVAALAAFSALSKLRGEGALPEGSGS